MNIEEIKNKIPFDTLKRIFSIKKIIAFAVVVILLVQIIVSVVVTEQVLSKEKFLNSSQSTLVVKSSLATPKHMDWLKENSDDVSIKHGEGSISAMKVSNKETSHSYVIMFHSLTTDKYDMASLAYHFYELGFSVIIPDYIEEQLTMGLNEKQAVLSCVDYTVNLDSQSQIFLFGVGYGGAACLLASAQELPQNVKGVISEGAYTNAYDLFKENTGDLYKLPAFPTVWLSSLYAKAFKGFDYKECDVLSAAAKITVPVLYIQGDEDGVVPVEHSNELYEKTPSQGTDHVLIAGADHGQCFGKAPKKYIREVDAFIMTALGV